MAIKGVDVSIQVDLDGLGTWTSVAGQRGASLNAEADTIDITSKDSNQWSENCPSFKNWSIDGDGLHSIVDAGLGKLWDEWVAGNQVAVRVNIQGGSKTYTGTATITSLVLDAPHDDAATASFSLEGSGALTIA